MTYTDIQKRLVEVIAFHFGVDEKDLKGITRKEELYDKYEPDSLDEVELIMCIEEHFNIELRGGEFLEWNTFDDMCRDVAVRCRVAVPCPENPRRLEVQVKEQADEIKALQKQLQGYNELKEAVARFINI